MSADIVITRGPIGEELEVAEVEGLSEAGVDFVDAYTASEIVVTDAGRIIVRLADVPTVVAEAKRAGLEIEEGER